MNSQQLLCLVVRAWFVDGLRDQILSVVRQSIGAAVSIKIAKDDRWRDRRRAQDFPERLVRNQSSLRL